VEYQYTVKEIRLVVGSKYKYEDLIIWHTQDDGMPNHGRAVGNAIGAFQDPAVNSPISTYFEESYLAPRHDTPKLQFFSGQYIYQPTNQAFLDQSGVYAQAEWLTTSDYRYSDYDEALRGILSGFGDGIHLQFKTGDGADGNATGGMVAGDLTGVLFEVAALNAGGFGNSVPSTTPDDAAEEGLTIPQRVANLGDLSGLDKRVAVVGLIREIINNQAATAAHAWAVIPANFQETFPNMRHEYQAVDRLAEALYYSTLSPPQGFEGQELNSPYGALINWLTNYDISWYTMRLSHGKRK